MTTGGVPGFESSDGEMPDKQGEVNVQHKPSAKSKKDEERRGSVIGIQANNHTFEVGTLHFSVYALVLLIKHTYVITRFLFCLTNVRSEHEFYICINHC